MIVAVEIQSVLDKYGSQLIKKKDVAGYGVLEYQTGEYQVIAVNCGAGEIAAASGTQFLISEYHVDMIINFGVAGGLTETMSKTKVCIDDKVVHYDFDTSAVDKIEVGRYLQYPDVYIPATPELIDKAIGIDSQLVPVVCASGDKFIVDSGGKKKLHKQFGADICEMESAGILLTCNRNNIPCMLIKIISDSINGGYEEFIETKDKVAIMCLEVIDKIVGEL